MVIIPEFIDIFGYNKKQLIMAGYLEGPLSKWTNVMKGWQYRWFVLDDNTGLLSYYTSKDKMMKGSRRGCVRLKDAIIGIDDEDDSTFTITVDHKVFHFQARDAEERKQWAGALEDTILRHSHCQVELVPSPSLTNFDRRLAEADTYLQLLIENVKEIKAKVNGVDGDSSDKQDVESILITAQEMIEAVKKSIVLLQLAKAAVLCNTSVKQPVNVSVATSKPPADDETVATDPVKGSSFISLPAKELQNDEEEETNEARVTKSSPTMPSPHGKNKDLNVKEVATDADGTKAAIIKGNDQQHTPITELSQEHPNADASRTPNIVAELEADVPTWSYSSSEDEDDDEDFFDADEEIRSLRSNSKKNSLGDENNEPTSCQKEEPMEKLVDISIPLQEATSDQIPSTSSELKTDPKLKENEDMYMQEENLNEVEEGESVEEHKSVIMHLLSQVKLGMDLTKVVLPTFILERRSLLEMYADFFSHSDLFVQISTKPTPEERMIACLRFYMSTFAAGRDSSVAKKPYNPILGETFRCFWEIPANTWVASGETEVVPDGPVPWAGSDQLSFLAEQVSHHPPVSAFYAEHKGCNMQFNGHIWTKSKFLGLSIGVHNIGQGCIRLLDRDEEYIINFPNGYGRSILTIPWVELGGDCTINCEKTGYNAFIKFHTKPFYGGKVHKVTGEIFEPNAKKPFCTMEGEWHTQMYLNHTTGRSESLIDTKKKKKISKTVRKLEFQEPFESRRLWQKVTINLKRNNIDEATDGKRALEDRQRQEAKQRLETGIAYEPKHFLLDACQNWIYKTPLTSRT